MKHSRQIVYTTNAAVDALTGARDDDKLDRVVLSTESVSRTASNIGSSVIPSHRQSSQRRSNYGKTSCSADDRYPEDVKETSSPSLPELSFNGTQRVRLPSRLLCEIKSPLEWSSSSAESMDVPGEVNIADNYKRTTPVKVIRHVNATPSAWILSKQDASSNAAESHRKPLYDDRQSRITKACSEKSSNGTGTQVSEGPDKDFDNETPEVIHNGKQNLAIKGLHQGEPHSGAPVFNSRQENAGDVKIKKFALSDKEKVIKDQFLKRQDLKKPTKKLVQPTLVLPEASGRKGSAEGTSRSADNPVVTAAAIAAAAASAATGPFLQLQHSLETQVAALVSNLQVLKSREPALQDKDKESELQHQMEERLQRLEELQAKMLQAQTTQAAPVLAAPVSVSYPVRSLEASLPTCNTTTTTNPSGPTYHQATRMAWPAEETQANEPYSIHAKVYDPSKEVHLFTQSVPAFERHKIVRNARTQTSPQESVLSEESPLQTPLPRKQPPMPMSRFDLPRSRSYSHRPRSDVLRRREQKERVYFDQPDISSAEPTYIRKFTDKGRGLVRELAFQNGFATGVDKARLEPQRTSHRRTFAQNSDTEALSSEVEKMKTDLGDIVTEMKSLKQELIDHQLHKDNVRSNSSTSNFRPVGPSPLDEYLVATKTTAVPDFPPTSTGIFPAMPIHLTHLADAEHILQDVQNRRKNLERNFEAVTRHREEQGLYHLVDNMSLLTGEFDDMLRIRRDVDKKIEEITGLVQREIDQETSSSVDVVKENSSLTKKQKLSGTSQHFTNQQSVLGKKTLKKPTGKENLPEKKLTSKESLSVKKDIKRNKSTKTQVPSNRAALVLPTQKQVYLSSVYGRQPYHPQRTTSKAPYLHYQSPVNPKTAAIMAGLKPGCDRGTVSSRPVLQDPTLVSEKEVAKPRKNKVDAAKPLSSPYGTDRPKYYFQPQVAVSYFAPNDGKAITPLEGQLVPMAIPLGKPKTNPALRPSIPTQESKYISTEIEVKAENPSPNDTMASYVYDTKMSPVPSPVRPIKPAWPNVAVITMYGKELVPDTAHQNNQHVKKLSQNNKKKKQLAVQVLPPVDIDSFSDTVSSSPSSPLIKDCIPEPVSRPDDSEYQEFRTFWAVKETGTQEKDDEQAQVDTDDDFLRIPTPQHPLTLEGLTGLENQPYNGPPFPPVHPPVSAQQADAVLEADTRQEKALHERAMEWVEQELLARIVSEMNQPVPDPTALTTLQTTPESSTESDSESDDADMFSATIGLGGVQLFVDAGIPVDRDLVSNLIREVIAENISTILGHPKPKAMPLSSKEEEEHSRTPSHRETPLSTPTPTPEYTPPESEESAHDSPVIATPIRTPIPSVSSEEATLSGSGDEENVFERVREEQNKVEETSEQVSEAKAPISTPVATPRRAQSPPASLSTPEPSIQEPEAHAVSQDTLVPTPTPSIVVKTPTPEPEPEPDPELSVAEELSQPKEPSVSQKKQTPAKSAKPSVSSPSSLSSTTLGTTTITTEEEMSDGEMIQPYAHAGIYSEGEFAISPSIVKMAVQRKLPLQGNWDLTVLGQDQDSRNERVRKAVKGLLQPEDGGRRRDHGDSSSSVSDSPYQASSASTLRDTEDIKEDSITDFSDREPGEIRPARDPMAVLLTHIQNFSRPAKNSASEGELLPEHQQRMPYQGQKNGGEREPGEIVPGNLSPGEVASWEPPGAMEMSSAPFPGEFEVVDRPVGLKKTNSTIAQIDAQKTFDGAPNHDDRSLHASDLLPGTLGTELSPFTSAKQKQQYPKPGAILVERSEGELSEEASLQNTYSVEKRGGALVFNVASKEKEPETSGQNRMDIREENNGAAKQEQEENEPQHKISVTLPSIDNYNVNEESSLVSDAGGGSHVSVDQDTFGNVSSISGGDF